MEVELWRDLVTTIAGMIGTGFGAYSIYVRASRYQHDMDDAPVGTSVHDTVPYSPNEVVASMAKDAMRVARAAQESADTAIQQVERTQAENETLQGLVAKLEHKVGELEAQYERERRAKEEAEEGWREEKKKTAKLRKEVIELHRQVRDLTKQKQSQYEDDD